MGCCGRPNNNPQNNKSNYYQRYGYLTSAQKEAQLKLHGSKCSKCDALTIGDPCSVCGTAKAENSAGGK